MDADTSFFNNLMLLFHIFTLAMISHHNNIFLGNKLEGDGTFHTLKAGSCRTYLEFNYKSVTLSAKDADNPPE